MKRRWTILAVWLIGAAVITPVIEPRWCPNLQGSTPASRMVASAVVALTWPAALVGRVAMLTVDPEVTFAPLNLCPRNAAKTEEAFQPVRSSVR